VQVCDAIYSLLEAYGEGSSRKNEMYLARHLPLFESQIGYACHARLMSFVSSQSHHQCCLRTPLHVEEMFTELIRDNEEIIMAMGEREVTHIIKLLRGDKNPDYLSLLSALCTCEEAAMGEHQQLITKRLLEESQGVLT
jgi:hypothetical protein